MVLETTLAGGYPKIGDSTEEQKLRRSLHQFDKGEITEEDLEQIKNEVTEEAIRQQIEAGLDIVTDGMIRWDDPLRVIVQGITGVEVSGLIRWFDTNTFYRQPIIVSRVEFIKPILTQNFLFAQERSQKPVKVVLTGPYTIAKLSKNHFYKDFKQFAYDLAHLLHKETVALEEAGVKYIQFDEPAILQSKHDLTLFCQIYEIVTAQLSKMEKTLHFNFGNLEGVYPRILNLNVERIGLELTPGHKNWDIIKTAPFTKKLMAGIVDARNTKMENESELIQSLHQLGESVTLDQTWLSTSHSLEFLPRTNARKKLELLANVAKQLRGASVS